VVGQCERGCGDRRAGLRQITDTAAIDAWIDEVMARNPLSSPSTVRARTSCSDFFVGQVMKATAGKANPAQLNELLRPSSGLSCNRAAR